MAVVPVLVMVMLSVRPVFHALTELVTWQAPVPLCELDELELESWSASASWTGSTDGAAAAGALAHGDVGAAAALVALGGHDLVVVGAEVQAGLAQALKWLAVVMVPPVRFCCRTLQYW